jgi:hypothetical protein
VQIYQKSGKKWKPKYIFFILHALFSSKKVSSHPITFNHFCIMKLKIVKF